MTDEYRDRINEYAALYPDYDADTITAIYCHDCRNFDDLFLEDSLLRVRSLAWRQTKHRLERGNIPDGLEPGGDH